MLDVNGWRERKVWLAGSWGFYASVASKRWVVAVTLQPTWDTRRKPGKQRCLGELPGLGVVAQKWQNKYDQVQQTSQKSGESLQRIVLQSRNGFWFLVAL